MKEFDLVDGLEALKFTAEECGKKYLAKVLEHTIEEIVRLRCIESKAVEVALDARRSIINSKVAEEILQMTGLTLAEVRAAGPLEIMADESDETLTFLGEPMTLSQLAEVIKAGTQGGMGAALRRAEELAEGDGG